MSERACESVLVAVQAHGLACVSHGDYFEVDAGNLWIRPDVYVKEENAAHVRVVLEVTAVSHLIGDEPIREAFAGSGVSIEAATTQAFGKFLLGSFHVLIEGLTSHRCESAQAEIEQWGSDDGGWTVYSGPLLTQHSSGSLIGPDFAAFFSQLQVLFESEVLPGPHWVRVFLGVMDGEIAGGEVLLDNRTWEPAQRMLFEFPWRCSQEYQTLRHFMLALPRTPAPLAIGLQIEQSSGKPWWKFW